MPAHHGSVVLLQGRGFDDLAQEAAVAQRVLLPLEALVQQLVVQQEQLVPQGVNLIRGGRTCSGRQRRSLSCSLCFDFQHKIVNIFPKAMDLGLKWIAPLTKKKKPSHHHHRSLRAQN